MTLSAEAYDLWTKLERWFEREQARLGYCEGKKPFDTLALAQSVATARNRQNGDRPLFPYKCSFCAKFHLRPTPKDRTPYVSRRQRKNAHMIRGKNGERKLVRG